MAGKLQCGHDLQGLVHPGGAWELRWNGWLSNEALGMRGVRRLQDTSAFELEGFGACVVNVGRGVEPDTRMPVVIVVPAEEPSAERAAVFK